MSLCCVHCHRHCCSHKYHRLPRRGIKLQALRELELDGTTMLLPYTMGLCLLGHRLYLNYGRIPDFSWIPGVFNVFSAFKVTSRFGANLKELRVDAEPLCLAIQTVRILSISMNCSLRSPFAELGQKMVIHYCAPTQHKVDESRLHPDPSLSLPTLTSSLTPFVLLHPHSI